MSLFGGCTVASNPDLKLGVPYRPQQLNSLDCGPASVLMWMLYDGQPEISQQTIGDWMGGTCSGVSSQAIADAVNHFTTADDAYWDVAGGQGDPDQLELEFLARQITSIDNATPVIGIIQFRHAGVINGGKWHSVSGGRQWDYVYFHDPLTIADDFYPSLEWRQVSCPSGQACEQIICSGATGGWSSYLQSHGSSVWDSSGGQPLNQTE